MKNILEILQENGIELTEDQKKKVNSEVLENYKTVADYETQKSKLETVQNQLNQSQKDFSDFKKSIGDVDPKELQAKLDDYEQKLKDQKKEYETSISKLNLESLLKAEATKRGCVDFDVAKGQINMEDLLKSKDQSNDIVKAFDTLSKEKAYLFKTEEQPTKTGKVIGSTGSEEEAKEEAELRAVMGLDPVKEENK